MKNALYNYLPLVPLYSKPPLEFTAVEAKNYFDWYMSHLEDRCNYLMQLIQNTKGYENSVIDFTFDSLIVIWKWFLEHARVMHCRQSFSLAGLLQNNVNKDIALEILQDNKTVFTTETEYLIRDIGMYVGKTFTQAYPEKIRWAYRRTAKRYLHVNEPLLQGFIQTRKSTDNSLLDKPFEPDFEPIWMVGVQAANIFDNTQQPEDLYNVCVKWSQWIPI